MTVLPAFNKIKICHIKIQNSSFTFKTGSCELGLRGCERWAGTRGPTGEEQALSCPGLCPPLPPNCFQNSLSWPLPLFFSPVSGRRKPKVSIVASLTDGGQGVLSGA